MAVIESLLLIVAGAAIALAADRLRWRHEDRRQWRLDRRDKYANFLSAFDEWRELDWLLAMEVGPVPNPDWDHASYVVESAQGGIVAPLKVKVGAANDRALQALTQTELSGSSEAANAAQALWRQGREVASVARDYPPRHCGGVSDRLLEADEKLTQVRSEFLATVRSELGVPA